MVPCLHQGNVNIKRKLRGWRAQKCLRLVSAETSLPCAGRQAIPSERGRYRAENGILCKMGWTYCHGTVFAARQCHIKRNLRVWRDQKCICLVGAETALTCVGRQTTPSEGGRHRAENRNLRKLGWTYRQCTMFAPRQCLYQKETRVWKAQKCICLVSAETPLTCAGQEITSFPGGRYRSVNGILCSLGWTYHHGTVFAPRQCLYQKETTGVMSPEMYLPSRCKKPLLPVQADKLPRLKGDGIGPKTETCVNWGGSIAMVPCLHQGNFYIKRKLRVWRAQKCICLVGAKTTLTCAGWQITPSQGRV